MSKRILSIICVIALSFSLVACGGENKTKDDTNKEEGKKVAETKENTDENSNKTDNSEEGNKEDTNKEIDENGTHEIVDHAGNKVVVPNKINKIVIDQIPILSTYMAYFEGKTPYIAGYAGSLKSAISNTVLIDISPELLDAKETVAAQGDLNIEEIMKIEPDVIFYNANNKKHKEELEKTGIPLVGFATIGNADGSPADPILRCKQWLALLEDVFQEKGKMDKLNAESDRIIKEIEEKIAKIPEDKRPSALTLFRVMKGSPMVSGKGIFGYFWLKHLGVNDKGAEAKGFAKVNFEQIYNWNPDILFVNGPGLCKIRPKQILDNEVEGCDFSNIKAVKDGRVYGTTLGMWNWFTPNPDSPLVLAWLACKTYPEEFKDYPLEETIKKYYKDFYNYELNDEQLKDMLEY